MNLSIENMASIILVFLVISFLLGTLGIANLFYKDEGIPKFKKANQEKLKISPRRFMLKLSRDKTLLLAFGFIFNFLYDNYWTREEKFKACFLFIAFCILGVFIFAYSVLPWKFVRKPWDKLTKSKDLTSRNEFDLAKKIYPD